ncbi:hypothetical protein F4859DRAFT_487618 [Xylaria cf. heliscus]|nr:hypothetical protein F4859DRAFT_487618 [Xylaria cf. heliscus]
MDHLPWNESTTLDRVRVPYVCRDGPCQSKTSAEFKEFPQSQGWELDQSESLVQLAERAQAWLFFGLLSIVDVSSNICIERDGEQPLVNTKKLPDLLLRLFAHIDYDERDVMLVELIPSIVTTTCVMLEQVIPFLRDYEALEPIDLWNSRPYAILFCIDVLLDIMKSLLRSTVLRRKRDIFRILGVSSLSSKSGHSNTSKRTGIVEPLIPTTLPSVSEQQSDSPEQYNVTEESSISKQSNISGASSPLHEVSIDFAIKTLQPSSLFPQLTQGVARSLLRTGRCESLAKRLDLTSSGFYRLISLPITSTSSPNGEGEGESYGGEHTRCSATSCSCFSVNEMTYRTRHTGDCVMCSGLEVDESKLVDLIRRDEVPIIQSTMGRDGRVSIRVQKMTKHVDYTAISHVWAGGLGNFQRNQLPQCQLEGIHRDVCRTMARAFLESFEVYLKSTPGYVRALSSWLMGTTTCYYWMDTLCIPNNHPAERKEAINSMGRVYAGAGAVLVLDPALSSIALHDAGLAGEDQDEVIDVLIQASPWMARSWPLQEAALASGLYIKFADEYVRYNHELLGIAATLDKIPNQEDDTSKLKWLPQWKLSRSWPGIWADDYEDNDEGDDEDDKYDEEIDPGQARPYKPGADFVKVWNLLAQRTTSYSLDVPAIFTALLYKSAGEILAIDPARRAWSLLGSVDRLPAEILCVELEEEKTQLPLPQHPQQWLPRLPGSSRPVISLSLEFGSLQRIASGFVLEMRHSSMCAVVCRKGLPMASGGHFLMRGDGLRPFLVHIRKPVNGPSINSTTTIEISKGKGKGIGRPLPEETEEDESQLILLFGTRAPGSPLEKCAVVCKINSESEDRGTLRIQFLSNAVTWCRLSEQKQQPSPACETRDCVSVDTSSSILIKMDTRHWPTLTWSRFNAYPYRHFVAQSFRTYDFSVVAYGLSWITQFILPILDFVLDYVLPGPPRGSVLGHLSIITIHLVALALRISVTILYTALRTVAQRRRARYFWSLSFWDLTLAQKTLSGIPFYVPWYFLAFDAAMLAGAIALFQARWPWKSTGKLWVVLKVAMPLSFLLEYGARLVNHLFARVQWSLTTIEYRGPSDLHSLRERLIASMLRYMVSSLQNNVRRLLLLCVTGPVGGYGLWLCYYILWVHRKDFVADPGFGVPYVILMIIYVIFNLGLTGTALHLLFYILRDLVRTAGRIYGRNSSVWREREGNEGQRTELV